MIIAENLSKIFYTKTKTKLWKKATTIKVEAVKDFSITVPQGKIIGLLGTNGAGKTTIIKMLSAMLQPSSGNIYIDNLDIISAPIEAKKRLNLITGGERNIYWRLSANENLRYFGALYGLHGSVLEQRISNILETVGLKENKDIPVEKFSKGMKQRLQIARGLINDPEYIFLDEPTLGLDIFIAHDLKKYIQKLAEVENKGILLTTHYIKEAEELCDYIYVIHKGKTIIEGTPEGIKKHCNTQNKIRISVLNNCLRLPEQLSKVAGVVNVKILQDQDENATNEIEILSNRDVIRDIVELLEAEQNPILKIVSLHSSLEDVLYSFIKEADS